MLRSSEDHPNRAPEAETRGRPGLLAWTHLLFLWLAGASLRMTVLAVPPLLPAIHRSLHLHETAVGVLSALPILLLAVAAVPGSLLISRVGARRALVAGLFTVAASGALRGLGTSIPMLFAMTLVMGIGIAVSQPSLPTLVRQWFPNRAGVATAVYSNGYLIGELAAAALTAPLILGLVGGSWQPALATWSIPVLLTGIAVLAATNNVRRTVDGPAMRWWPNWRDPLTWRLGLILGSASVSYWGANAFIPEYLRTSHHANLITPALTVLNLSQLPASFIVAGFSQAVVRRRWPLIAAGLATSVLTLGLALGGVWVVIVGGALGFASALVFILSLALPPIVAGRDDVHRMSAAMFTISYTCPFVGSLLAGAIWDATSIPLTAFLPTAAGGIVMALLATQLHFSSSVENAT